MRKEGNHFIKQKSSSLLPDFRNALAIGENYKFDELIIYRSYL